MPNLLLDWVLFNQTSKSVDDFNKTSSWIQTSKTCGQVSSDTSPYEVCELFFGLIVTLDGGTPLHKTPDVVSSTGWGPV